MKKTMKILAVLMTLCLIFGVIVINATAEAAPNKLDASQYGEGITVGAYDVVPSSSNGGTSYQYMSTSTQGSGADAYFRLKKKANLETVEAMLAANSGGLKENPAGSGVYEYANGLYGTSFLSAGNDYPVGAKGTQGNLGSYDYLVYSMDFMADSADENGRLSYPSGSSIATYGSKGGYKFYYIILADDGNWYISLDDQNYSSDDVMIANEVGAWNNLTVVYAKPQMKAFAYINGEFLASFKIDTTTSPDRIVFNLWYSRDIFTDFSVGLANATATYYAIGYESQVDFGLTDYFNTESFDYTRPISDCGDIVFNSSYTFNSGKNVTEFAVKKANGEEKTYNFRYEIGRIASTLTKGDVIVADLSIDDQLEGVEYSKYADGDKIVYEIKELSYLDVTTRYYFGNESTSNSIGGNIIKTKTVDSFAFVTSGVRKDAYSNANFSYFLTTSSTDTTSRTDYPQSPNQRYVVIDFDVAARNYVYLPDGESVYKIVSDPAALSATEKATMRLAYMPGGRFALFTGGSWDSTLYYIYSETEKCWYLNSANEVGGIRLSNTVNEYNHVTIIADTSNKRAMTYVNGEYLCTQKLGRTNVERIAPLRLDGVSFTSACDFNYENIVAYVYSGSYSSAVDDFGLDDYISLMKYEYPISFIEDIKYSKDFASDASNPTSVTVKRGDEVYKFYNLAAALDFAESGDTLIYDKPVTIYQPLKAVIKTLNVTAPSVTLVGEALKLHGYSDGVISKNASYDVVWHDVNGEVVLTETLGTSSKPNPATIVVNTGAKGDYNLASAWEYEGENGERIALSDFTSAEVGETIKIYPKTATVVWNGPEGELLATEKWLFGSKASYTDLPALPVNNGGWYELGYFWNDVSNDMIVDEDNLVYNAIIRPYETFAMTNIKYNYVLGTRFHPVYYVPVSNDANVTVTGAVTAGSVLPDKLNGATHYDDITSSIAGAANTRYLEVGETVRIGDASYYKFVSPGVTAYSWYSVNGFEVKYTVKYEGVDYELSSKVAMTRLGSKSEPVASYINSVMKASACGSEDKQLILNWMRYISIAYANQGGFNEINDIKSNVNNHTECCGIKPLESFIPTAADESLTYKNIGGDGIFGATYIADNTAVRLAVLVEKNYADTNEGLAIKASYKGIVTGYNRLQTITSDLVRHTKIVNTVESDYIVTDGDKQYYAYVLSDDVAPYNGCNVMEVSVYDGEALLGSATYSLAEYAFNTIGKIDIYTYDAESGKYSLDESKLTDGKYNQSQRSYQLVLAYMAFAEAAYNYKTN